ncbi:hypothetical protein N0V86_004175 [Didymella sp. IMI 355093]|nr:hypothetical protein N0V86_004175 [Didymella sp. IMI 355093]
MPTRFDFTLFMQFPAEVREDVYGYVLKSDKPIRPHLCDVSFRNKRAKFHDENAAHHSATFPLTHLTRASKKLREESLPVFYSVNSFDGDGNDTATYFAWLESIGRLHWVLHVNLVIPYHSNEYSARILWTVCGFDQEIEDHNSRGSWRQAAVDRPHSVQRLREHPRYSFGGVSDLNLWIMLRMLSTSSGSPAEPDLGKRIVLPVSNVNAFNTDSKLRWLSTVARGLGIELRLVEQPGSAALLNGHVYLQWNRKYQGEDVITMPGLDEGSSDNVLKRAREAFPDIERMARSEKNCFYREPCDGEGTITWFDMLTMGGGRS